MKWRFRSSRFLREMSVANVQGIASLAVTRLERKLGEVPTSRCARSDPGSACVRDRDSVSTI